MVGEGEGDEDEEDHPTRSRLSVGLESVLELPTKIQKQAVRKIGTIEAARPAQGIPFAAAPCRVSAASAGVVTGSSGG